MQKIKINVYMKSEQERDIEQKSIHYIIVSTRSQYLVGHPLENLVCPAIIGTSGHTRNDTTHDGPQYYSDYACSLKARK